MERDLDEYLVEQLAKGVRAVALRRGLRLSIKDGEIAVIQIQVPDGTHSLIDTAVTLFAPYIFSLMEAETAAAIQEAERITRDGAP